MPPADLNPLTLDRLTERTGRLRMLELVQGGRRLLAPTVAHARDLGRMLGTARLDDPLRPSLAVAAADAARMVGHMAKDQGRATVRLLEWFGRAAALAAEAGDWPLYADAVGALAVTLAETGAPGEALALLADVRQRHGHPPPAALCFLELATARAHAATGDAYQALTALDRAAIAAEAAASEALPSWSTVDTSHALVAQVRAQLTARLGLAGSVSTLLGLREEIPAERRRSHRRLAIDLAMAGAKLGDVDLAAYWLDQGRKLNRGLGSRWEAARMRQVLAMLPPDAAAVRLLRDRR